MQKAWFARENPVSFLFPMVTVWSSTLGSSFLHQRLGSKSPAKRTQPWEPPDWHFKRQWHPKLPTLPGENQAGSFRKTPSYLLVCLTLQNEFLWWLRVSEKLVPTSTKVLNSFVKGNARGSRSSRVPGRYAHNTIGMMSLIRGFLISWEVSGWMVSSPNYSNENFIIKLRWVWKWELPPLRWLCRDLVWAAKRVASVSLDREPGQVWTADEERPGVALEITWEHSVSEVEEKPKQIQWNAVWCVALEPGHPLWVEYVNLGSEWDSGCAVNDHEIQSCPRLPSYWAVMEGINLKTVIFLV